MSCGGLHCPGCSEGQSLGILGAVVIGLYAADRTVTWVAERIWWIGGTAAACFAVSAAVSMALEAWSDRRGIRYAAAHGILSRADVIASGHLHEAGPAPERREIAPQVTINCNFYGADGEQVAARVIRQALPGDAGAAITSEDP